MKQEYLYGLQYPANVITLNSDMAFPLSTTPHMSTRTPGAFDSAAEAIVPVMKRPMRRAAKLFAKAHRKLNAMYSMNVA